MISPNEYTLALDCSLKNITIAIIKDQKILASFNEIPNQSQSSVLLKVVDDVLKTAQVNLDQIKNILYCRGPGSFTSLRIGLATLKGLFLDKPIQYYYASSLLFRCFSQDKKISVIKLSHDRFAVGILEPESYKEEMLSQDDYQAFIAKNSLESLEDKTNPESFLEILKSNRYTSEDLKVATLNYMFAPDYSS